MWCSHCSLGMGIEKKKKKKKNNYKKKKQKKKKKNNSRCTLCYSSDIQKDIELLSGAGRAGETAERACLAFFTL